MASRFFSAFVILFSLTQPIAAVASNAPTILFFIDASGSMRGEKLQNVKEAIGEVVPTINENSMIALYAFGSSVREIEPATLDRTLILSKLDLLEAKGKTSLYDALSIAVEVSESLQPSRVIFLSDGKDTSSEISYAQISNIMMQSITGFEIVGLQVDPSTSIQLQDLATKSEGNYYESTEIEELINLYKNIIEGDSTIESEPIAAISVVVPENRYYEYALAGAAGIIALLLFLFINSKLSRRSNLSGNSKLIQNYVQANNRINLIEARRSLKTSGFLPSRVEKIVRSRLEVIHSESYFSQITFSLWSGLLIFVFFGLSLFGNVLVATLFSIVCVSQIFNLGCKFVLDRQRDSFDEELPEMLNVVASGLSAGLGLQQSLEAFASDSEGEVGIQLRRALGEMRVGTPVDDALLGVASRMENANLKWVVTALSIQRIVGGSLATVIRNAYETMRSRSEIKREVKTLSAEGRLSANVLIALPIFIFLFLFFTRPEYISVLWSNSLGIVLLLIVAVNMLFGILWMKKIVDIKI